MRVWLVSLLFAAASSAALAQSVPVPDPGFETRPAAPPAWTLDGGPGAIAAGRASVTGDGQGSHAWHSPPLPIEPGALYVVRFRARSEGGRGGTPISGPVFCNRDLGDLTADWRAFRSVCAAPAAPTREDTRLRFGQWMVAGTIAFDDVELARAQAVHRSAEDFRLGEGERVAGNSYAFEAPYAGESRNSSRPLARHSCRFNTNRWVFGSGDEVVYRHDAGTRRLSSARITVDVTYHVGGALLVQTSADAVAWRALGRIEARAARAFDLPGSAPQVWVRLLGGEGCALQVGGYGFSATLDGAPLHATGHTDFVEVLAADARRPVRVQGITPPRPGESGEVVLRTPASRRGIAFDVPGPGTHDVPLEIPELGWRARVAIALPAYRYFTQGEQLPGSTGAVTLWWAASGWKIPPERIRPARESPEVRVALARNEAEAVQLVVGPAENLRGLRVETADLIGPGGAVFPIAGIEVLRVRYLDLARPTDETGSAGEWPDPLPPLRGPIDVRGGRQQPLWIRVTARRDQPPGTYRGRLALRAEGWQADAPLAVEVFDFALPDRMSCTTAFGFDPWMAFHYHGATDLAQQREVLEKYWASFAAHRIAPYDPAPLDPWRLTFAGGDPWQGGVREDGTLRVSDDSHREQACARYDARFAIPAGGLRLRLRYRTAAPGQRFIVTLGHCDSAGAWMSGRNLDLPIEGTGAWQELDRAIPSFPDGAAAVELRLWATEWQDDGGPVGTVWYDDVSLAEAVGGKELVTGGDFSTAPEAAPRPVFDWSAWDAEIKRVRDARHFNSHMVRVPGMGGGTFHSRVEPSLEGFAEGTPQYAALFRACAGAIESHLRDRGWLADGYVYWFDEPEPRDYEFVLRGFGRLKEAAPGLARMLTEQPEPALMGGPDVWCPCTPSFEPEAARAALARGERLWWYVCTGPKAPYATLFIDHAATELRVWLWQAWQRGITGVLVWQTNYWSSPAAYPEAGKPQDPYADPMSWMSGYDTPAGTRVPWGNGDGRFLYPPESPGGDGPVDSIRWEMLRDGIEDYEYLAMLRSALARVPPDQARRFEKLLEIPPEITRSLTDFTTDPAPIEERRRRIARALEEAARQK